MTRSEIDVGNIRTGSFRTRTSPIGAQKKRPPPISRWGSFSPALSGARSRFLWRRRTPSCRSSPLAKARRLGPVPRPRIVERVAWARLRFICTYAPLAYADISDMEPFDPIPSSTQSAGGSPPNPRGPRRERDRIRFLPFVLPERRSRSGRPRTGNVLIFRTWNAKIAISTLSGGDAR